MATTNGGNAKLADKMNQAANVPAKIDVKAILSSENVRKRFEEVLGKHANAFISSVISTVNNSYLLRDCDPMSVVSGAAIAAALNLPIEPQLGYAFLVPYNVKQGDAWVKKAQFQISYKGLIQLALRSGQYLTINASEVYAGEIKSHNRFTGAIEFGEKTGDAIVGYCAYFKLLNGYEKYLFMTVDEVKAHGAKFSKTYAKDNSVWKSDFHAMALKTVLRRLISRYGIMSIEMQTGYKADQAVISQHGIDGRIDPGSMEYEYIDAEATIEDGAPLFKGDAQV